MALNLMNHFSWSGCIQLEPLRKKEGRVEWICRGDDSIVVHFLFEIHKA